MDIDPERKKAIGKIVACFRAVLNKDLDMSSFEDRIRLQKIIYILRRAGLHFGYSFNWHIRGPYSPKLADNGYAYKENKEKSEFSYLFSEEEEKVVTKVKSISDYLEIEENSELLASLLYLSRLLDLDVKDEKVKEELKTRKPRFSDEEIRKALETWAKVKNS